MIAPMRNTRHGRLDCLSRFKQSAIAPGIWPSTRPPVSCWPFCSACCQGWLGVVGQAGDKVVYSKYAGTDVAMDGVEYVLLKVRSCNPMSCPLRMAFIFDCMQLQIGVSLKLPRLKRHACTVRTMAHQA